MLSLYGGISWARKINDMIDINGFKHPTSGKGYIKLDYMLQNPLLNYKPASSRSFSLTYFGTDPKLSSKRTTS
jgi:hypothetical protein